jgi:hypothetical protein
MANQRNRVSDSKVKSDRPHTGDLNVVAEADTGSSGAMVMQRGVTQLLFHYLPGRTVDWENGLAIVMLTNPRLSSVWSDEQAAIVLDEINLLLDRWRKKAGRVDRRFPDPVSQRGSFAIGSPESIEAELLETALICQNCSYLHFVKLNKLAHPDPKALTCPHCEKGSLRQLGQVFVHGCGEFAAITEWMPATKKTEEGSIATSVRPLRCTTCGPKGKLAFSIRTERVKDMKLECRKCGTVVLERLTARCKTCLEELTAAGHASSEGEIVEAVSKEIETKGSVVARIAMRMARYNANSTYYPQTLSMLRLDRPAITKSHDRDVELLRRMLPMGRRPSEETGAASIVAQLASRLDQAEINNDTEEIKRIKEMIFRALRENE